MPNIHHVLSDKNFVLIHSPGDGHCLFHSFVSSWNAQVKLPTLTVEEVLTSVSSEWDTNKAGYLPFIDTSELSAVLQWEQYIFQKHYNIPLGDAFPHILANAFKVDLNILNELSPDTCETILTGSTSSVKLYLHRVNDNHYNGIGPCPIRILLEHQNFFHWRTLMH